MIMKALTCCLVSALAGGFVGAALTIWCMDRWRDKWEEELEDFDMGEDDDEEATGSR